MIFTQLSLFSLLAVFASSAVAAMGLGGGTVLLLYLSFFSALSQPQMQAVNLLLFLPAAADGDSAPADQSMKQQINADAGEQDDSSTQVSQPSVQPESSSSAGESAEASAQPGQQQSSEDFSLTLPVSGAAITPFSGDMLVKNETLGDWRTHNGIDISAATGTAVTAASDGIVTSVYSDPMWGNVVEVTSGEVVMTYAGLGDDIAVSVDQQVTAGETLGSVGQIPCELSLEPHLHFDVQVNGDYVDPASLVE